MNNSQDKNTKLWRWIKLTSKEERVSICCNAGIKHHFLMRLAHNKSKNPGLNSCRDLVDAMNHFSNLNPDRDLPYISLNDIGK